MKCNFLTYKKPEKPQSLLRYCQRRALAGLDSAAEIELGRKLAASEKKAAKYNEGRIAA